MMRIVILAGLALGAGAAFAKLPPLSDDAKAKAAETAAKNAHNDKIAAYQLCKSMDKVAAKYQADAKKAGKEAPAPTATPPCTDPGAFVYTPPQSKPLEAAGAHSPPGAAMSPPNTTTPAAAAKKVPAKKS